MEKGKEKERRNEVESKGRKNERKEKKEYWKKIE